MRPMNRFAFLLPAAALLLGAAPPQPDLQVELANLRNGNGLILACLSRDPQRFLDCDADPLALKRTLAPGQPIRFAGFPPGRYALTVFHDENANRKLDMLLGIPREGFGFSRNPKLRFGAPKFQHVGVELQPGFSRQSVRMQYVL
jgi:uncharacterized protein (DUF2141 family)